ncbi:MAG: AAA family ATPase [Oscillospiraceae bacterium]|nr:AAA family ATPase [Oscillospiraceae bacterium]
MEHTGGGGLFVIEGIDGSGKTTQYERLLRTLEHSGVRCCGTSFPNYDSVSGALVKAYLGGAFGDSPDSVNAYAASSFFAVDRCASFLTDEWGRVWRGGGVVVSARYTTSNAIHQASKLPRSERRAFFAWLEDYEYEKLGLPRPDTVLFLEIPAEAALERIRSRETETGVARDIHERDAAYLAACAEAAEEAADFFGWKRLRVAGPEGSLTPDEVARRVAAEVLSSRAVRDAHY